MECRALHAPEKATVHRLPNGLTVVLLPLPYVRSVSAGVWIGMGSGEESAEDAGISHFLEHLFFRGTHTRSAYELMAAVEGHGGHINAYTARDYTCVYVRSIDDQLAPCLNVLADIVKNSALLDFEMERGVLLEEIAAVEDVPEDHVHDLFVERLWPDHAMGRPVGGSAESVSALTRERVGAYYDERCRGDNMILAVAGRFDPEGVLAQVCEELGDVPSGTCEPSEDVPRFSGGVRFLERDAAQQHVCLGFPAPTVTDEDRYVFGVLSTALGGGSTSRLFERIREREGLAYAIYSFRAGYRRCGLLGVYAAVAPTNFARATELAFEEIRRLKDELIPEDELALSREQLKGSLLISLESTAARVARLAKSMVYFGREITVDEILQGIDAVTPEDVQRVSRETFTPEQCACAVLGPNGKHNLGEIPL